MSAHRTLPPLPVWAARSTLAVILAAVQAILLALGVDLYAVIGIGEEKAIDAVQGVVVIGTLVWLWWERRAPNRRLVAYSARQEP